MLGFSPLGDLPLGGLPGETAEGLIGGVFFVDLDTFGTTVVGRGSVSVAGALYTNPDTFGTATIVASYAITGARYSDPDTFGSAALFATYGIAATVYSGTDSFGSASLEAGSYKINGQIYPDPDTFGTGILYTPLYEFVQPGHERCMRCGFIKGRSSMRREWTGLLVCEATCWDPRHPQMSVRGVSDDQKVPWVRPPPAPVFLNPNDVSAGDL